MFYFTNRNALLLIDINVVSSDGGLIAGVIGAIFVLMGLLVIVVTVLLFMKMK